MPRVTLAQMQERVWNRVEVNTLLYPSAEVTRAINSAVKTLNNWTGFFQQTVPLPTLSVVGRVIYEVPSPIFVPLNVRFERRSLEKSSLNSACYSTANILTRGGIPRYWVPLGLRKFTMTPIDTIGGRYLECTGICDPPRLVNATDSLALSDEYTQAVEDGAFMSLITKEGGKILADAMRTVLPMWKERMRELARWDAMKNPQLVTEMASTR